MNKLSLFNLWHHKGSNQKSAFLWKKSLSSYSVVFVCRWWRRRWWICQWLPGASQVLGARVVGWHCPPLTWTGRSTSTITFSETATRYRRTDSLRRQWRGCPWLSSRGILGNNRCLYMCICFSLISHSHELQRAKAKFQTCVNVFFSAQKVK